MTRLNSIRKSLISNARLLRWPAAALAVGIMWSLAETLIIRYYFNSGLYFGRGFTPAFNGRIIFYGLVSVVLWGAITLAVHLWRRVFRGRPSLASSGPRAVAVLAAAAAWVNLSIVLTYAVHTEFGVPFRNRLALIVFAGLPAMVVIAAFVLLIIRLRLYANPALKLAAHISLTAALIIGACSYGYEWYRSLSRPRPSGLPDVVFITLDAWRADALRPDISPALARFAQENGLVFENARAPSSWTLPSFAATLTGSYNITEQCGLERRDDIRTTWAEVMRNNGYDTFAVVDNPYLDTNRLLTRGFNHYDNPYFKAFPAAVHFYDTAWYFALRGHRFIPDVPGEAERRLTRKVLSLLRKPSRRPKFIWVHYLNPHFPYQPAAAVLAKKAPYPPEEIEVFTDKRKLSPDKVGVIKTLYECEVESTDRDVAPLLAELAAAPNKLVIISSDHGEEFYEHGGTEHARTLYDEVCRVPLIIALPEARPDRPRVGQISSPVSLIDLAPSVLTFLGFPVPPTMEGRRDVLGGRVPPNREIYLALNSNEYLAAAIIAGDRKVIATISNDALRTEYYDLKADPEEQRPLPPDRKNERLKRKLLNWLCEKRVPREEPGGPSPFGDRADLRALGYM